MAQNNRLRIIGGRHRGRVLRFPDVQGLRPTSSRLRETLFNWLQFEIEGMNCLDLFCGSGALGLEALSRGAAQVQFVDRSTKVIKALKMNLMALDEMSRAQVTCADAFKWLQWRREDLPFDLVFLDPPFVDHVLVDVCRVLLEQDKLADNGLLYLEQDAKCHWPELPPQLRLYKQARVGQAACRLLKHVMM